MLAGDHYTVCMKCKLLQAVKVLMVISAVTIVLEERTYLSLYERVYVSFMAVMQCRNSFHSL
jgi:hypothetical protein